MAATHRETTRQNKVMKKRDRLERAEALKKTHHWPQINADDTDQNRIVSESLIRRLLNYPSVLIRVIGVNLWLISLTRVQDSSFSVLTS